jgi:glutamyl-tRNA synthetase
MTTKLRFAPSPTGLIHLGNSRTALFNALLARKEHGVFLLRIEDTDKARSSEEFALQLQRDLQWLDLPWQEGPQVGGDNGPYFQSQRQHVYNAYYQLLEDKKLVYPCFCSETELAITRKVQLASGQPPRYAGTCRHLTATEIAEKRAQGLHPVLRFHIPANQVVEFVDFVKGPQRFNTNDIGDFIIRRADGTSSFMFCNAIDDATMKVTHVLRGEDHLTNTPRQILILQALHLPAPQYGHLSLIMGHDGSPLSKRHGSRNIYELHEEGFLPIGVLNYLARLGHSYENPKFMSLAELAAQFKVERLSKSPARFDAEQLLFWQKEAVAACNDNEFWQWLGIEVHSMVPPEKKAAFIDTVRANINFPKEALHWAQVFFDDHLAYNDEQLALLKTAGSDFFLQAIAAVEQSGADFSAIANHIKQTIGAKGKDLFQPLRIALTQEAHGPEMSKVATLLGTELLIKRFKDVLRHV